jgi:5-methylcytosine-specific restriction endonuclease McrA
MRKNLCDIDREALLQRLHELVRIERETTLELIDHLRETERRMLYAELGYGSLFEFAVRHLGLSEGSAHRRISAMRLARDLPEARKKIESGELSLSNAARLQVAFRAQAVAQGSPVGAERKRELLTKACGRSQRECELTLAAELPQAAAARAERVRPVAQDRVELTIALSVDHLEKLDRLRGLLAHALGGENSYASLLERLADRELERLGRRVGAARPAIEPEHSSAEAKIRSVPHPAAESAPHPAAESAHSPAAMHLERSPSGRASLPARIRRLVWSRAAGRCEFPGCESRHRLEVDHCRPVALGGDDASDNLRLLCRAHNIYEARRILGTRAMERHVPVLRRS